MRDKCFELETKLVLLNFYEHTSHGRSHSCDLTDQYELVPSDIASRRYRSLPESSRERSPTNHNSSQPDSPENRLSRSELRPEILSMRLSQNSSEVSSGSFDSSNTDADDEMDSNPSIGSNFSQQNISLPHRNRLSTVYSDNELILSPEIHSERIPPPNFFPQNLKDSTADESSDLQVDACRDSSSSLSSNPNDEVNSFHDEVRQLMENLQSESEELLSLGNTPGSEAQSRPLSPISDAAKKLGKISDEIQQTYGPRIDQSLCSLRSQHLTYTEFCSILNNLLGPVETNWIMISAVMLFSKRCAHYFFNQGVNYMSRILDFTTIYLEDVASEFIINNGGWVTISEFSEDQLLDSGLQNSGTASDSDNNSLHTLSIHPVNTNLNYDENDSHIPNIPDPPLEYINPEPSEQDLPSPNNLYPTAVVALAAMLCASFIYLTN